jgi:acyl-CoA synthetase (NDP forming)
MNNYRLFQRRWKGRDVNALKAVAGRARKAAPKTFEERRDLLLSYGIPMAAERLARTEADAVKAAETIGYPVAVKIESKDLPHKSDVGGVVLNVKDAASLRDAFQRVIAGAKKAAPSAAIDGVSIQKMAPSGTEMVLGAIRDPDFGPLIMLGFGGIYVEILRDTVLEPSPIGPNEARDMVQRLKARRLLEGVRGAPKRDVAALEKLIVDVSRLMMELGDDVQELEMNPVIVHAEGQGLTVVDSLFVVSKA